MYVSGKWLKEWNCAVNYPGCIAATPFGLTPIPGSTELGASTLRSEVTGQRFTLQALPSATAFRHDAVESSLVKEENIPQKLLPLQHRPAAHLTLGIAPHVSPALPLP